MAGTVRGKVDCFLNETSAENASQCVFKLTYDFLERLTSLGVCERVARHTGRTSGTTEQRVTATDFYDGNNPFLQNCWCVFKFPANENRQFDWYLQMQWNGNASFGNAPGNPGFSGINFRLQAFQAAIGVGGSPWNGTTYFADGDPPEDNDSRSSTVWVDPGGGLYVFPRTNAAGGSRASAKDGFAGRTTANATLRVHLFADDDNFLQLISDGDNGTYSWIYMGLYEPRDGLPTEYNFVQMCSSSAAIPSNTSVGTTSGTGLYEGGIVQADGSQVRGFRLDRLDALTTWRRIPNGFTGQYDVFPYTIFVAESPVVGYMGQVTFIKETVGLVSHDASLNPYLDRAVLSDMNVSSPKMVTPWSPSVGAAPRNNWTRAGVDF